MSGPKQRARPLGSTICHLGSLGVFGVIAMAGGWILAEPVAADDRSTEVLRYACSNQLGRRDITLFANGTVRLRQGLWDDQEMRLDELLSEELSSYLNRLRQLHHSADLLATGTLRRGELHQGVGARAAQKRGDQQPGFSQPLEPSSTSQTWGPQGEWVDDCEIVLDLPGDLPGEELQSWRFTALDVPPLAVTRLIQIAEDLADFTRPPSSIDRVPADYRPQRGDLLQAADGQRFRVLALTVDGRGVELEGVDSPMRIFVGLDELPNAFSSVEELERR
ncbi:MAG: hypothetical protein AAF560_16125 [Acidobacteriota bacterium]